MNNRVIERGARYASRFIVSVETDDTSGGNGISPD